MFWSILIDTASREVLAQPTLPEYIREILHLSPPPPSECVPFFEDSRGKACLVVATGEKHGWRKWRRVWIVAGSDWSVVYDSFGLAHEG